MAVGRDEIRDLALGQEMEGLNGWIYPYQTWVIDEKTGDMIGLWKQVYEGTREDGTNYALEGIQGSWFQARWQLRVRLAARLLRLRQCLGPVHRDADEEGDERRDAGPRRSPRRATFPAGTTSAPRPSSSGDPMTDTARRPSSPYADLSSSQLATLCPSFCCRGS